MTGHPHHLRALKVPPQKGGYIMQPNEIVSFDNPEFGQVRAVEVDGNPIFFRRHCKGVAFHYPLETAGGTQKARFITEPDVYRLITHSKLPNAQRFEAWVFEEVLPSIRRTGGYVAAKPDEMKPKAVFADAVATSRTSILIGDLAKILKQNGVDMGQRRLFEWMRQRGYLMRASGSSHNMPTQRSMERGWFEIKETSITHSDGHITVQRTPKATGKGQQYFINLFLNGAA